MDREKRTQRRIKVEKAILKIDHIQKYYGDKGVVTKAINDISFEIKAGEFVGIMGASGEKQHY